MNSLVKQTLMSLYSKIIELLYGNLARASAWLCLGSVAAGVLGYVFQILMGRMLSTNEYGVFSAMMALFAVLAAPLSTLMMVVTRKISEYHARHEAGNITHFYYSINIHSAIVGLMLLGVYMLFAKQVQFFLKAPSINPIYLLGVLLFVTFLPVINNSFLQGLQNFSWLSASSSLGLLLKIIFATFLVSLDYGVAGVLGGAILAAMFNWIITYGVLRRQLLDGTKKLFKSGHLHFRPVLPVFVANIAFSAMTQLDVVLVNYFFQANEAGLYAAASILGKAVMYLPAGIAMAIFPMAAENHARDESSTHLMFQAVGLTSLLCGIGAVFYLLFGEMLIVLLYGDNYRGAGEILKYYGFAILPMAFVMVAEFFLIAKGRVLFAYLFLFTAPLQFVAIYIYHESLQMVVGVVWLSGLLLAFLGYGLLWRSRQA